MFFFETFDYCFCLKFYELRHDEANGGYFMVHIFNTIFISPFFFFFLLHINIMPDRWQIKY